MKKTALPESLELWTHDRVQCNVCTYNWVAVRVLGSDVYALECPSCEATDSDIYDSRVRRLITVH